MCIRDSLVSQQKTEEKIEKERIQKYKIGELKERKKRVWSVSYTHLDVYKRQLVEQVAVNADMAVAVVDTDAKVAPDALLDNPKIMEILFIGKIPPIEGGESVSGFNHILNLAEQGHKILSLIHI